MARNKGTFIVLEGADGSGKTTQLKLLAERLKAVGYDVEVFDFPRYNQQSSYFVRQYLNGAFGPASRINPFTASLFYALDRFEAAPAIREALNEGKIVLSDRFVGSNMAHQGAKFNNPEQQRGFFVWEDNLEFELLGIPRPDLNIFLRLPPEISQKLMSQRGKRGYTSRQLDEHEADLNHLKLAAATYDSLYKLFPKDYKVVESSQNGRILPIPVISDRIWQILKPLLPENKPHKPRSLTVNLESKEERPGSPADKNGSKTSSDFIEIKLSKVSLLGLNQLSDLPGVKVKFESSWGGNSPIYDYYAMPRLGSKLAAKYRQIMRRLIEIHRQMSTDDKAVDPVLAAIVPQAALAKAKLRLPRPVVRKAMLALENGKTDESGWLLKQLKTVTSGNPPTGDTGSQPESLAKTINRLSENHLNLLSLDHSEPVKLLNYWPRNEFELLVEGLYPYANLSNQEISEQLDTWKYEHKQAILQSLIRRGSSVLEEANYRWDIICDRLTLNELIEIGSLKDLRVQAPTPRFGYELPAAIEEAKAEDMFIEAFDLSLELFSDFQAAGREELTGYATLLGHKLRCQIAMSAKELKELSTEVSSGSQGLKKLVAEMVVQAEQVHPSLYQNQNPEKPQRLRQAKKHTAVSNRQNRKRQRP